MYRNVARIERSREKRENKTKCAKFRRSERVINRCCGSLERRDAFENVSLIAEGSVTRNLNGATALIMMIHVIFLSERNDIYIRVKVIKNTRGGSRLMTISAQLYERVQLDGG